MPGEGSSRRTSGGLWWVLLLAAAAFYALNRLQPSASEGEAPIPLGTPLPPFHFAGWLDQPGGKAFDPAGQLVVVDCWATW
jgi:hypothetical protein